MLRLTLIKDKEIKTVTVKVKKETCYPKILEHFKELGYQVISNACLPLQGA